MREKLFANGKWYYSLPILTVGLFAWVPFLHAAAKTHRAEPRKLAIIYGVVAVVLASLSTLTQSDAEVPFGPNLSTLVTLLIITSVAYACYRLHPLRVAVYGLDDPPEVAPTASQQAVALALGDRGHRDEARKLASSDPALARDLHIGRPDLPHTFEDGGLVDLNAVSAEIIAAGCGVSQDLAGRIVDFRKSWGGHFSTIEEALAYVDMSEAEAALLRDRGICMPA